MNKAKALRRCILVLGMHRSGTSAVTRMLSLLGATLPENLMPAAPENNATGFWEPQKLVDLNDRMLKEAGSRWDDWRPFDGDALPEGRLDFYKHEIGKLIESEFGQSRLTVLKDPRISRLVPLYVEVLKGLGIEPHFVLVGRNPGAVTASLEKRDRFTRSYGNLIWLRHELDAEYGTRDHKRVFVSYENLLVDWRKCVNEIRRVLHLRWPVSLKDAETAVEAEISIDHQHCNPELSRPDPSNVVMKWVMTSYHAIDRLSNDPQDLKAMSALDEVRLHFNQGGAAFADAFYGELSTREIRSENEIQSLKSHTGELSRTVDTLRERETALDRARDDAVNSSDRWEKMAHQFNGEVAAAKKWAKTLESQVQSATDKMRAAQVEAVEINRAYENVLAKKKEWEAKAHTRNGEAAAAIKWAKSLEERVDSVARQSEKVVTALQIDLQRTQQSEQRLRQANADSLNALEILRHSTSWRLTRPLRGVRRATSERGFAAELVMGKLRGLTDRLPFRPLSKIKSMIRPPQSKKAIEAQHQKDIRTIKDSGLFDETYYREQIPSDLQSSMDPVEHYSRIGHKSGLDPNRTFVTAGYLGAYPDIKDLPGNPFVHFLKHGRSEGRLPNPFSRRKARTDSRLVRYGSGEYGPIGEILAFESWPSPPDPAPSLCVHLHLFHMEMAEQFALVLNRIDIPFTLLISVPDETAENSQPGYWHDRLHHLKSLTIKEVVNRGRDVAPWLIDFREEIETHDLFLHMHSKRSPYSSEHAFWFRFLSHSILGSQGIANQVLGIFDKDSRIGLVSPAYAAFLDGQPNFGQVRPIYEKLVRRLGYEGDLKTCLDFPAGSFFWCRTDILKPLFDLGLTEDDFDVEAGQTCGTLAHALERVIGVLPVLTGYRLHFVAIDVPFEKAPDVAVSIPSGFFLSEYGADNFLTDLSKEQSLEARQVIEACTLKVSVIMATWNRRPYLEKAIDSILAQSHPVMEIIVCDDGSSDGTADMIKKRYSQEIDIGLIRLLELPHKGVSAARNAGLDAVRGDIVAYLDSDNTWREHYCLLATATFHLHPHINSVYAGLSSTDKDQGEATCLLRDYDRALLISNNFIDLNIFAHRREIPDRHARFDESLARLVDWDMILKITREDPPMMIPYIGAEYRLDGELLGNISHTVPLTPNLQRLRTIHKSESMLFNAGFQLSIKCPVPSEDQKPQWGDWHFAKSLKISLERQGFDVRIDILPDWYSEEARDDQVAIILRGLSRYEPSPSNLNIMWNISHPDKVPIEEYEAYDHAFIASMADGRAIRNVVGRTVTPLLQCSDANMFRPTSEVVPEVEGKILFVGNSRGVDRWIPKACLEAGIPFIAYGTGWEGRLPSEIIKGQNIPNDELYRYYSSAAVVMNDHWPEMARRGYVSNRIFDAGLCGAHVVSDDFAGSEIFSDGIDICRNAKELKNVLGRALANPAEGKAKGLKLRHLVAKYHTFDHRALQIADVIRDAIFMRLGIPNNVIQLQSDRALEHRT